MPDTNRHASSEQRLELLLTPAEVAEIERLASREGTSKKEAVLKAVRRASEDDRADGEGASAEVRPGSFLDGVEDLIGSVEGPGDLSTNPEHMAGYGRD
jgi:hypothetical protein